MSLHIPRILLVDDDPALLHCLCDLLTYRLRPAVVIVQASSDHVVADVTEGHYDVVVCDFKMPHQDWTGGHSPGESGEPRPAHHLNHRLH